MATKVKRTRRDSDEAIAQAMRRQQPLPHAFRLLVVVQRLWVPRGVVLGRAVLLEQNLVNFPRDWPIIAQAPFKIDLRVFWEISDHHSFRLATGISRHRLTVFVVTSRKRDVGVLAKSLQRSSNSSRRRIEDNMCQSIPFPLSPSSIDPCVHQGHCEKVQVLLTTHNDNKNSKLGMGRSVIQLKHWL